MRKKSHISLARFLVRKAGDDVLRRRWKAFYVGSLLPDCRPSFLTVRHEYDETIDLVEHKIRKLMEDTARHPEDSMRYMIDLGQVFRERAYALCVDDKELLYSVEDILDYIRRNHQEYMEVYRSVEEDCEYITRVCLQVLAAMVYLVHGSAAAAVA